MVEIKLAIGSKEEKKVFKHLVSGADAEKLFGKKLGEKFRGEVIGLNGYELEITGGSDKSGFPMRKDVEGSIRKKIVVTRSLGFKAKIKGQRKRRSLRGNTISAEISQINCKVIKVGKDKLAKLLGAGAKKEAEGEVKEAPKKEEPKAKEAPKEEMREEKPVEEPKPEEVKEEEPKKEEAPTE